MFSISVPSILQVAFLFCHPESPPASTAYLVSLHAVVVIVVGHLPKCTPNVLTQSTEKRAHDSPLLSET